MIRRFDWRIYWSQQTEQWGKAEVKSIVKAVNCSFVTVEIVKAANLKCIKKLKKRGTNCNVLRWMIFFLLLFCIDHRLEPSPHTFGCIRFKRVTVNKDTVSTHKCFLCLHPVYCVAHTNCAFCNSFLFFSFHKIAWNQCYWIRHSETEGKNSVRTNQTWT